MTDSSCPCRKKRCDRHGDCEACRKHHKNLKRPPYCERKPILRRATGHDTDIKQ